MTAWVARRERGESPNPLERDADEAGGTSFLLAGDPRCSCLLSFGSSGEMVDRAGARTATDAEDVVDTERGGGGGGGGAGFADVGIAGGIGAALLCDGGGLKISSSKEGERTRFRFVFDGVGSHRGVVVVVVVVEAGAVAAATSGTTSFSGRGGDGRAAAERTLLAREMLAMVPAVTVSSVQRECRRFLRDGGDSGGGEALRVRFVADFVPTFADDADGRGAECCLRSRSGGGGGGGATRRISSSEESSGWVAWLDRRLPMAVEALARSTLRVYTQSAARAERETGGASPQPLNSLPLQSAVRRPH